MFRAFTIYENPSDFPGKFVVRGWTINESGQLLVDAEPTAVVNTLVNARQAVPADCCAMLNRSHLDDPVIKEVWL